MADFADTVPLGPVPCALPPHRSFVASLQRANADDHERVAATIDARVAELETAGFNDVAMLSLMVEHASGYRRLMREVPPDRQREFMQRYAGLVRFGALLTRAQART